MRPVVLNLSEYEENGEEALEDRAEALEAVADPRRVDRRADQAAPAACRSRLRPPLQKHVVLVHRRMHGRLAADDHSRLAWLLLPSGIFPIIFSWWWWWGV